MTVVFRTLMPKVDITLWDLHSITSRAARYCADYMDIADNIIANWRGEANG